MQSVDLEKWKDLSDLSDEDGKRQVKDKEVVSEDQIFLTIAKIRGWA